MQSQQGGGGWGDVTDEYVLSGGSSTVGDLYEVRLVKNSGVDINGGGLTAGTWYRVDSTREYTFDYPATNAGDYQMQLRRYSDGTLLRDKQLSMQWESF